MKIKELDKKGERRELIIYLYKFDGKAIKDVKKQVRYGTAYVVDTLFHTAI